MNNSPFYKLLTVLLIITITTLPIPFLVIISLSYSIRKSPVRLFQQHDIEFSLPCSICGAFAQDFQLCCLGRSCLGFSNDCSRIRLASSLYVLCHSRHYAHGVFVIHLNVCSSALLYRNCSKQLCHIELSISVF